MNQETFLLQVGAALDRYGSGVRAREYRRMLESLRDQLDDRIVVAEEREADEAAMDTRGARGVM